MKGLVALQEFCPGMDKTTYWPAFPLPCLCPSVSPEHPPSGPCGLSPSFSGIIYLLLMMSHLYLKPGSPLSSRLIRSNVSALPLCSDSYQASPTSHIQSEPLVSPRGQLHPRVAHLTQGLLHASSRPGPWTLNTPIFPRSHCPHPAPQQTP